MSSTGYPTLVKAPPVDESKAPIENALELTELSTIGPVSEALFSLFLVIDYRDRSIAIRYRGIYHPYAFVGGRDGMGGRLCGIPECSLM